LDLRFLPGIQFGQRDLSVTNNFNDTTKTWKIEGIFIDLPISLKFRSVRVNNFAPYVIAGFNSRLDLIRSEVIGWRPATPMLKFLDFYPELGVGVDFYLDRVKVAMELKFSIGLRDIFFLDPDLPDYHIYSAGISGIYSRMFGISFHVEQSQ